MDTKKEIVFAISEVGASHIPKNVACQDYSLKWEDENVQLVIVCDGHGSKTYVRSDVGSRLAGEIAKEAVLNFINDKTNISLLENRKGAVTARPSDSLWGLAPCKPIEEMTETERQNYEQNVKFSEQVEPIPDIDAVFKSLFEEIYSKWVDAIVKDSKDNPFTSVEKDALGKHRIEKAYGSTLMAFVKTAHYWFAFHVGDGRLIIADRHLEMSQPVPWDCNCFQNLTTSLCNTGSVNLFRYAFDGTGQFPVAVFCCSDGIEDSYGDYEINPQKLHDFYRGLLDQFVKKGKEITLNEIKNFLPVLSAKGSRDDMSLAGIINLDGLQDGLEEKSIRSEIEKTKVKLYELEKQENEIKNRIEKSCSENKTVKNRECFIKELIIKIRNH